MVQLIWTTEAYQDLKEIFSYFDALSHEVAIKYTEELLSVGDRLLLMPEMGQKEPMLAKLNRNYRYVLVQRRYKVIYLYEDEVCSILMIWDCNRNPIEMINSDRFTSE